MDDYLTKPVRPFTLQRTLERWISQPGSAADGVGQPIHIAPLPPDNDVTASFADCATELLQLLIAKLPEQLELLDGALAMQEANEVRAHAHKLKGSLLTVSATVLAKHAEHIQHLAETGDITAAEAVYAELLTGYQALERTVKKELSRRARADKGASVG